MTFESIDRIGVWSRANPFDKEDGLGNSGTWMTAVDDRSGVATVRVISGTDKSTMSDENVAGSR